VLKPNGRATNRCPSHAQVATFTDRGIQLKVYARPRGRDGFAFKHPEGGYVVYDAPSKQFRNDTRRRVLVATWCLA
jgi:hypothetical protein